jgi:polyisoprenoid-binding protein YceI
MMHYRFGPDGSRFTVQAFAGGLLSMLAHCPIFSLGDFDGDLRLDSSNPDNARLMMLVRADSLKLVDPISAAERREIEERMLREILEVAAYPEIRFESERVGIAPAAPNGEHRFGEQRFGEQRFGEQRFGEQRFGEQRFGEQRFGEQRFGEQRFHVRVLGHLSLHGVTKPLEWTGRIENQRMTIHLIGETPLRLSAFGIRPVTALAGASKLRDQLLVAFDLTGRRDEV